jgi:hypothetical protein
VVWVGNNYAGDLPKWTETPIESYLGVGGNVLLLTRWSEVFLTGNLEAYLGANLAATGVTQSNMTAVHPSFVNVPFTGSQSYSDLFSTSVDPKTTVFLQSSAGGTYASGLIAEPPGGGTFRADGGKFAHIAGRPYRMNHAALRTNVETILKGFFGEPYSPGTAVPAVAAPAGVLSLAAPAPNPFRGATTIAYRMPAERNAELGIYDVSGRLVRTLLHGVVPAGPGEVRWDGRDGDGNTASSGVYFVRLRAGDEESTRQLVRLR